MDDRVGFDLAPSETALASAESRRSTAYEFVLRRQLAVCRGYDVVLVECPPSLGVLTLNALAAASHLVVVTDRSFLTIQGIEELLETRDVVCAHYNPDLTLAGVVVNRVERTVEHRVALAGRGAAGYPRLSQSRSRNPDARATGRATASRIVASRPTSTRRSCARVTAV